MTDVEVREGWDLDEGMLTPAEFGALTPTEQLDYLNAVEKLVGQWVYTPRQATAERLSHQVQEILYGGAAGGGKSEWLLHHTHDLSMRIPGHHSLLVRKTFPELDRSLIMRSIMRIKDPQEAHYKRSEKRWYYRNGSIIEFGHLDDDKDISKYLSAEYDFIGFDEGSQFSQYQVQMLSSRARVTRAKAALGARAHIAIATNPGGPSHGYIKKRYVLKTNHGEHTYVDEDSGRSIAFVPAKVSDNSFMDPAYEKWLMSLPEIERRQYLYGDWDVFAGQYFAEFDRDAHVIRPFTIPESWARGRGIDYGYTHPFACVWVAWDNDGRAYVYREFERTKLTPEQQARHVRVLTAPEERVSINVADPSTWGRHNGVEKPINERWSKAGLHCTKATNNRIAGWSNIRSYLQPDADGKPMVFFFDTCPRTVETLTELIHDDVHVEDAAAGDDHLPDAVRYILAARARHNRLLKKVVPATLEERIHEKWEKFNRRRKGRRFTPQGVM